LGRILLNRAILLSYIGPLAGLDIYIQAIKWFIYRFTTGYQKCKLTVWSLGFNS
jgi:hypothetical protein